MATASTKANTGQSSTYYAEHANELGWGPDQRIDVTKQDVLTSSLVGTSLLDVGCGPGMYVDAMTRQGVTTVGVDFAWSLPAAGIQRGLVGTFICASALELPFADRSFDTVSMLTVLEHIPDDESALKEIIRVARRRIILIVPQAEDSVLLDSGLCLKNRLDRSHCHYYTAEAITALVEKAGARVVKQYAVNAVAIRMLIYRSLRLPRALISVLRVILKLLPWRYYYNEWVVVADVL